MNQFQKDVVALLAPHSAIPGVNVIRAVTTGRGRYALNFLYVERNASSRRFRQTAPVAARLSRLFAPLQDRHGKVVIHVDGPRPRLNLTKLWTAGRVLAKVNPNDRLQLRLFR